MDKAYQHLRNHKVRHASIGPQRIPEWNKAAAGIRAFYFKDPDGHNLEIIYFPPGKGDPRWQKSDKLFLGIDHTAIVVSDTARSLKFYGDALGLKLVGESENYGPEQERLNNVFGARLHISGLQAPSGPGIEFLEYLQPGPGRPYPVDSRTNDIWHWQTTLLVQDAASLYTRLKNAGYKIISNGLVGIGNGTKAFIVRDADGQHAGRGVRAHVPAHDRRAVHPRARVNRQQRRFQK